MGSKDPSEFIVRDVDNMTDERVSEKLAELSNTASRDLLRELAMEVKILGNVRGGRFKTMLMHVWLEDI